MLIIDYSLYKYTHFFSTFAILFKMKNTSNDYKAGSKNRR